MRAAIVLLTGYLFLIAMSTSVSAKSPVQGGLPAVVNRVTELEDRVDALENDVAATHQAVMDLEDRVESLENEAATKDDVMDLSDRITALTGRVEALEQATHPIVFDGEDSLVGPVIGWGPNGSAAVAVNIQGQLTRFFINRDGFAEFRADSRIDFSSSDCSGQPLLPFQGGMALLVYQRGHPRHCWVKA